MNIDIVQKHAGHYRTAYEFYTDKIIFWLVSSTTENGKIVFPCMLYAYDFESEEVIVKYYISDMAYLKAHLFDFYEHIEKRRKIN